MIEVKIRRFAGAQKKPAENLPEQPAGFTKNLIRNKRRTGQKQTRCFWPVWRSKRDLNPRGTFAPYALSRGKIFSETSDNASNVLGRIQFVYNIFHTICIESTAASLLCRLMWP